MSTATIEQGQLLRSKLEGIRAFLAGADHLCVRDLGDGRTRYLCQMLLGNVRLNIGTTGDKTGYYDGWCFHDADAAWRAVLGWDGQGEPEGWVRHINSGRRRPDGTSESEYVNV
jgi:hypothetical protein